jgi:hypothetical protein
MRAARLRLKENVKMDLQELVSEGGGWIDLTLERTNTDICFHRNRLQLP